MLQLVLEQRNGVPLGSALAGAGKATARTPGTKSISNPSADPALEMPPEGSLILFEDEGACRRYGIQAGVTSEVELQDVVADPMDRDGRSSHGPDSNGIVAPSSAAAAIAGGTRVAQSMPAS